MGHEDRETDELVLTVGGAGKVIGEILSDPLLRWSWAGAVVQRLELRTHVSGMSSFFSGKNLKSWAFTLKQTEHQGHLLLVQPALLPRAYMIFLFPAISFLWGTWRVPGERGRGK